MGYGTHPPLLFCYLLSSIFSILLTSLPTYSIILPTQIPCWGPWPCWTGTAGCSSRWTARCGTRRSLRPHRPVGIHPLYGPAPLSRPRRSYQSHHCCRSNIDTPLIKFIPPLSASSHCPAPSVAPQDELLEESPDETLALAKRRNPRAQEDGTGPIVVIIRHGKTEYNKLGLFTGKRIFKAL